MLIFRGRDQPNWSILEQHRRYRAPSLVESECRRRPSAASSVPGSFGREVGGKDAGSQPSPRAHCVDVQFALTVPCVADRALQRSVAQVLSAIYEQDFLPCSFGGRPGRGAHQALATLHEVISGGKVEWVLEADLKNFLDPSTQCPLIHEIARVDRLRF